VSLEAGPPFACHQTDSPRSIAFFDMPERRRTMAITQVTQVTQVTQATQLTQATPVT
jgi:hypothetical protein